MYDLGFYDRHTDEVRELKRDVYRENFQDIYQFELKDFLNSGVRKSEAVALAKKIAHKRATEAAKDAVERLLEAFEEEENADLEDEDDLDSDDFDDDDDLDDEDDLDEEDDDDDFDEF